MSLVFNHAPCRTPASAGQRSTWARHRAISGRTIARFVTFFLREYRKGRATMSSGRLFFDLHRPTDDKCAYTVEEDQNRSQFDYTMLNLHNQKRDDLVEFTSQHLNLRFGDGVNGLASPQTIDQDSSFRNDTKWTPRGVQQLPVRTYHAVPDLSGGAVHDTKGEEGVAWGDSTFNRSTALSGVFIEQQYQPLIPSLQGEVQDAAHIVEPWTRGGDSTREASRSLAFIQTQGYGRGDTAAAGGRPAPYVRGT
eukprot:jgi/Tetstr1/454246/TSEL_041165.t1